MFQVTRIGFIRALLPIVGLVIGERAQRGRIVNDDEKRGKREKEREKEKERERGSRSRRWDLRWYRVPRCHWYRLASPRGSCSRFHGLEEWNNKEAQLEGGEKISGGVGGGASNAIIEKGEVTSDCWWYASSCVLHSRSREGVDGARSLDLCHVSLAGTEEPNVLA